MRIIRSALVYSALAVIPLHAQDVVPGRVIGQDVLLIKSAAPNIIEGRELNSPQGVALDTSVSPPAVYVSDAGNHRVLGWRNAASFQNGAPADLILGQKDKISSSPNGPGLTGSNQSKGLYSPTGLLVDARGNLYVVDSGNNRILRFDTPFNFNDPFGADQVFGQEKFDTRGANQGGRSASTLALNTSVGVLRGSMAFDSKGNLWVTDPGNHRVLRYPADGTTGFVRTEATLALGQSDLTSGATNGTVNDFGVLRYPSGLAIDSKDNIYVTDSKHRLLVFTPSFSFAQKAKYFAGAKVSVKPVSATSLNTPDCVAINPANEEVVVCDTANNRVVWYPPLGSQWIEGTSPTAYKYYGQTSDSGSASTVSATGLSSPAAAAMLPSSGEMFVADALNNRVVVYPSSSQSASRVLGQLGLDYRAPNLIEGKELYLYDYLQSSGGSVLLAGGGVAVDTTGSVPRLYIADTWNNRVLGYCDARKAKQGDKADLVVGQASLLHSAANGDGGSTPNSKNLWFPTAVATDKNGRLYVADLGNGRVLRFAAPCSQPAGQQSFPTANLVLGQANFVTHETDPNDRTMSAPFGLVFSSGGHLLVSDFSHNRVLRFNRPSGGDFSSGQAAAFVFGQPDFFTTDSGTSTNQFKAVRHLGLDRHNRLLAADYTNNRVLIFSNADEAVTKQPSASFTINRITSGSALSRPLAVWSDMDKGDIYVASAGDSRVLHYPDFDALAASPYVKAAAATAAYPLAGAMDARGNLFVPEAGNRVLEYFPAATTLNGASYVLNHAIAPGSLVSAWIPKTRSVPSTHASALPLPRTLAGLQVMVGGVAAPMLFAGEISSTQVQINFQMPMGAPSSGFADIQVVEAATQEVYGAWFASMGAADPGIFTTNSQGVEQVSAMNVDSNKNRSCNGPVGPATAGCPGGSRPAKPGEVLELYLTGQGAQTGWPAEGEGAPGAVNTGGDTPMAWIGTGIAFNYPSKVDYSGTAPGFAGLWQVNVVVPSDHIVPDGKTGNPIIIKYRDVFSQPLTKILIQQN